MSAYVVARLDFKGKKLVNVMLYSTMFIPATALTYPVYNLVNKLHLYDTRGALILIYSCSGLAVSFFVIKNYYMNIPKEMEDAARIDGCGYVKTWQKVIFPMARPGIMTAGVLAFLNNWNEYYWASLVLIDREKLTVPALLSTFTTSFRTNYNGLFSGNGRDHPAAGYLVLCIQQVFRGSTFRRSSKRIIIQHMKRRRR